MTTNCIVSTSEYNGLGYVGGVFNEDDTKTVSRAGSIKLGDRTVYFAMLFRGEKGNLVGNYLAKELPASLLEQLSKANPSDFMIQRCARALQTSCLLLHGKARRDEKLAGHTTEGVVALISEARVVTAVVGNLQAVVTERRPGGQLMGHVRNRLLESVPRGSDHTKQRFGVAEGSTRRALKPKYSVDFGRFLVLSSKEFPLNLDLSDKSVDEVAQAVSTATRQTNLLVIDLHKTIEEE